MKLFILNTAIPLLSFHFTSIHAFQPCPFLGPVFPEPTQLSTSPIIKNATSVLQAAIQDAMRAGTIEANSTSYSVEIFSVHEPEPVFKFHHTSSVLANSTGTKIVDSNSVYRIASISKLLTVYLILIESGDVHFNEPISKYVPELAGSASKAAQDPVGVVDWDHITIGNLASQLGGIGRDGPAAELGGLLSTIDVTPFGLPPLKSSDYASCGNNCTREEFFTAFSTIHPVFAPATTPIYSNVAFRILGYALEAITGKPYETIFTNTYIENLKLKGTSYSQPKDVSHGVIPPGSAWDLYLGDNAPGGGFYSSSADLATIGRSILSSSLLTPALTRRWMKPVAHSANPDFAVGSPWEIARIKLPQANRVVELYTKTGALPQYNSLFVLIPDWGIGLTVLAGGPGSWEVLTELIGRIYLPAVEDAARAEADRLYSGTYVSSDPNLNSSITLTTDPSLPGLGISNFISNGTAVLQSYTALNGVNISVSDLSYRLYPTNLITQGTNGDKKVAWRSSIEYAGGPDPPAQVFDFRCFNWGSVDGIIYGGRSTDDFVMTVGGGGAKSIEPRFLRVVLDKV